MAGRPKATPASQGPSGVPQTPSETIASRLMNRRRANRQSSDVTAAATRLESSSSRLASSPSPNPSGDAASPAAVVPATIAPAAIAAAAIPTAPTVPANTVAPTPRAKSRTARRTAPRTARRTARRTAPGTAPGTAPVDARDRSAGLLSFYGRNALTTPKAINRWVEIFDAGDYGRGIRPLPGVKRIPAGTAILRNETPIISDFEITSDGSYVNRLRNTVGRLAADKQEKFCQLTWGNYSDNEEGRMAANAWEIEETRRNLWWALSMANHDCRPNGRHELSNDVATIRTTRDIVGPGTEILISYDWDVLRDTVAKRDEKMQARWGFSCQCAACSNPVQTDQDRTELKALRALLMRKKATASEFDDKFDRFLELLTQENDVKRIKDAHKKAADVYLKAYRADTNNYAWRENFMRHLSVHVEATRIFYGAKSNEFRQALRDCERRRAEYFSDDSESDDGDGDDAPPALASPGNDDDDDGDFGRPTRRRTRGNGRGGRGGSRGRGNAAGSSSRGRPSAARGNARGGPRGRGTARGGAGGSSAARNAAANDAAANDSATDDESADGGVIDNTAPNTRISRKRSLARAPEDEFPRKKPSIGASKDTQPRGQDSKYLLDLVVKLLNDIIANEQSLSRVNDANKLAMNFARGHSVISRMPGKDFVLETSAVRESSEAGRRLRTRRLEAR